MTGSAERDAGPVTPGECCQRRKKKRTIRETTTACGYGSRRSPGRQQSEIDLDLRCNRLAIKRIIQSRRQVPTEGARHRAAAHAVEPVLRHEGREGAAHAAEEGFDRGLREQK